MLGKVKGLLGGAAWGRWWPESPAYNECGTGRRLQETLIGKELIRDLGPWHLGSFHQPEHLMASMYHPVSLNIPWHPCVIPSASTSHRKVGYQWWKVSCAGLGCKQRFTTTVDMKNSLAVSPFEFSNSIM